MMTKIHIKKSKKDRSWRESGQILIIATISLFVLIGFVALAADVGYLRYVKQRMQGAADAAALAGASQVLYNTIEPGAYITAAKGDAKKNGFEDGVNGVTVAVNNPPSSGPHTTGTPNAQYYVEVIIKQDAVPTFFMKVLGISSEPVSARAVGLYWTSQNCMYALSSSASGAFRLTPSGGYAVDAKCGIMIDSNSSSALQPNGNTLTADSIGIVGGCSGCGANVTPSPQTGAVPVPDPLGYLPTPTPSGTSRANPNYTAPGSYTLQPGIYASGITLGYVGGKAGPDVTFAPGNYYITGGSLTVNSPNTNNDGSDGLAYQHVNIHGSDVFIYLGKNIHVSMGGGKGNFVNSYGGLSAPTTGTYEGILFFQDRGTTSYTANVSSGLGTGFTGALYFPSVALRYNNSAPTGSQYLIMVANTVELYRDNTTVQTINYDTSGLPQGSPIRTALLSE